MGDGGGITEFLDCIEGENKHIGECIKLSGKSTSYSQNGSNVLTRRATTWYPATIANAARGDEAIKDKQYAKRVPANP